MNVEKYNSFCTAQEAARRDACKIIAHVQQIKFRSKFTILLVNRVRVHSVGAQVQHYILSDGLSCSCQIIHAFDFRSKLHWKLIIINV